MWGGKRKCNCSWLMFTQNTDRWRQRRDLVISCANNGAGFFLVSFRSNPILMQSRCSYWNKTKPWSYKKNKKQVSIKLAFNIWNISYILVTSTNEILYCLSKKKNISMLQYNVNTFLTLECQTINSTK